MLGTCSNHFFLFLLNCMILFVCVCVADPGSLFIYFFKNVRSFIITTFSGIFVVV